MGGKSSEITGIRTSDLFRSILAPRFQATSINGLDPLTVVTTLTPVRGPLKCDASLISATMGVTFKTVAARPTSVVAVRATSVLVVTVGR